VKRDPLVLDKVTFVGAPVLHPGNPVHSFTPNGDCRYDLMRIRFRTTVSDNGTVQVVKPGRQRLVVVSQTHTEGHSQKSVDCLEGNPGNRRNRTFKFHLVNLRHTL